MKNMLDCNKTLKLFSYFESFAISGKETKI